VTDDVVRDISFKVLNLRCPTFKEGVEDDFLGKQVSGMLIREKVERESPQAS
jgi:hypothetical protein